MFQTRRFLTVAAMTAGLFATQAFAQTEVRITWYDDGNEGQVLRDLLDRFEEANPDIKVTVDTVAYQAILDGLPVQLAAGEGPDIARVTDLGGLSQHYLDLSPHLSDTAYWEESFGPFLKWLRQPNDTSSIPGFMTQLTVTGPYVNKTLFEQAEVGLAGRRRHLGTIGPRLPRRLPRSSRFRSRLPLTVPVHRVSGPAISMGANYFDDKGEPALIDDGLKAMAQRLYDWHQDGTMAKELWVSVSGSTYLGANEGLRQRPGGYVYEWLLADLAVLGSDRRCLRLVGGACPLRACCLHRHAGWGPLWWRLKTTEKSGRGRQGHGVSGERRGSGRVSMAARCSCRRISAFPRRASSSTPTTRSPSTRSKTFAGAVPNISQVAFDLQGLCPTTA